MINVDDNYNITNREILDIILPQNENNSAAFIQKCKHLRIMFNIQQSTNICIEYNIEKVFACVYILCVS